MAGLAIKLTLGIILLGDSADDEWPEPVFRAVQRDAARLAGGDFMTADIQVPDRLADPAPVSVDDPDAVFLDLAERHKLALKHWEAEEPDGPERTKRREAADVIEVEIRNRPAVGCLGLAVKIRFFLENFSEPAERAGWQWDGAEWHTNEQMLVNAYTNAMRLAGTTAETVGGGLVIAADQPVDPHVALETEYLAAREAEGDEPDPGATDRVIAIECRIITTPATSAAGLAFKLQIVSQWWDICECGHEDDAINLMRADLDRLRHASL